MTLTFKEKYNKKYELPKGSSNSLISISRKTGIPKKILQDVFNRGVGAWKNNIQSVRLKSGKKDYSVTDRSKKMSKDQWAYSRVYSFVMGGKTQKTTDKDLYEKYLLY